jgi:hypothetical protein
MIFKDSHSKKNKGKFDNNQKTHRTHDQDKKNEGRETTKPARMRVEPVRLRSTVEGVLDRTGGDTAYAGILHFTLLHTETTNMEASNISTQFKGATWPSHNAVTGPIRSC